MTLKRTIVLLLLVFVLVSVVFVVLYSNGGTTPGDGQGEPVSLSR